MLRRNDDAGNMSPTDTRIGIPESELSTGSSCISVSMPRLGSRFLFFPAFLRIGFLRRILLDVYVYVKELDLISVINENHRRKVTDTSL